MMRSTLYQTNTLSWIYFYSTSSLKQQSAEKHVAPLGHIIPIPSQAVFVRSPYFCMLSRKATNINFIVFALTRSRFEPTIYHTHGEHAIITPPMQNIPIFKCTNQRSNTRILSNSPINLFIVMFNLRDPYVCITYTISIEFKQTHPIDNTIMQSDILSLTFRFYHYNYLPIYGINSMKLNIKSRLIYQDIAIRKA